MDKDWDEKCEHREFQTKRAEGFAEAEAKTAKNREKRQKKKQNKEQAKQAKNAGNCSVNMSPTAEQLIQHFETFLAAPLWLSLVQQIYNFVVCNSQ